MTIPILNLLENWYCPNCGKTETIPGQAGPHTRFHVCPKLAMLTAPLLREGTAAKVERKDREDYEGEDAGWTPKDGNGRTVMSVVTTRDEGRDVIVFAPTAHATGEALGIHPSTIAGAGLAAGTGKAH